MGKRSRTRKAARAKRPGPKARACRCSTQSSSSGVADPDFDVGDGKRGSRCGGHGRKLGHRSIQDGRMKAKRRRKPFKAHRTRRFPLATLVMPGTSCVQAGWLLAELWGDVNQLRADRTQKNFVNLSGLASTAWRALAALSNTVFARGGLGRAVMRPRCRTNNQKDGSWAC